MSALWLSLVHGTAVAAVAWALELGLRRWVSPAFLSGLWTVVLVKFFVPFAPAFRFSLSSAVQQGALAFAPLEVGARAGLVAVSAPWLPAIAVSYAVVVAGLGARQLLAARRMARVVSALPLASSEVRSMVESAASALKLRSIPHVRVGAGPFVAGVLRPVLVLPDGFSQSERARAVLLHELEHLRRGDHWVRLLQTVAGVLFFFWPPVAWICRKIDQHRELACDQAALTLGSITPLAYARALFEAQRSAISGLGGAAVLEMASKASRLENRIDRLLTLKRKRSAKVGLFSLAIWAALALGGSALGDEPSAAGPMEDMGELNRSLIQQTVRQNRAQIRSCYESVMESSALAGKLVMGWTIARDGATRDVHVVTADYSSPADSAREKQLQNCIVSAIASWTFPRPPGNGEIEVAYPFVFMSADQ